MCCTWRSGSALTILATQTAQVVALAAPRWRLPLATRREPAFSQADKLFKLDQTYSLSQWATCALAVTMVVTGSCTGSGMLLQAVVSYLCTERAGKTLVILRLQCRRSGIGRLKLCNRRHTLSYYCSRTVLGVRHGPSRLRRAGRAGGTNKSRALANQPEADATTRAQRPQLPGKCRHYQDVT